MQQPPQWDPQGPSQYQQPQYPQQPPRLPSWAKPIAAVVVTLVALWGISAAANAYVASQQDRAYVQCQAHVGGFACTVTHQQGNHATNVCWDTILSCRNGQQAVGHACQALDPSQVASRIIPESDIQNLAQCDTATGITVEHLSISAR